MSISRRLRHARLRRSRRATSRASTSTISPTSGVPASTRASSWRATANGSPRAPPSFDPLHEALTGEPTLVDETLDELTRELVAAQRPDVVGDHRAVPRQRLRRVPNGARDSRGGAQHDHLMLGGGWVNTELRALREPRVFDYFDYVTLDDGERPLLNLLSRLAWQGRAARAHLRAPRAARSCSRATPRSTTSRNATPASRLTTACRSIDYVSVHRDVESDASALVGRALEQNHAGARLLLEEVLVLRRVARLHRPLRPAGRRLVLQRIRALIEETGETGFHLVDEAAPPAGCARSRSGSSTTNSPSPGGATSASRKPSRPSSAQLLARVRLRGGERRARGGLGPAAGAHEEGCHRRAGGARDARVHRRRHHGARLSDVRLPDGDRAGHDRRARARAPAVRRGLHPVGATGIASRLPRTRRSGCTRTRYGITLPPAGGHRVRAQRRRVRRSGRHGSRLPGAGLRKALYNYMHGVGLDADVRSGSSRWRSPCAAAAARAGGVGRAARAPQCRRRRCRPT